MNPSLGTLGALILFTALLSCTYFERGQKASMSEALYHTKELALSGSTKLVEIWRYRASVGTHAERKVSERVLELVRLKAFDLKAFHRLKDDFLALYADDPKQRAEVVSLLAEFVEKYPVDDGFSEKAVKVARETVALHPRHPEAHLLLATMLSTYLHERPAENIRHYVACLRLESTHEGCRRGYGRLVDALTAERCQGDAVRSGLSLSFADDKPDEDGRYAKKAMYEGTLEVYLPKKPTLTGMPLAREIAITKDRTIFFFPTDEAAPLVDGMLRQPGNGTRNLVLLDGDEVLAAVRMSYNMSTYPILFVAPDGLPNAPGHDALLKRFCKKTFRPQLPSELRI